MDKNSPTWLVVNSASGGFSEQALRQLTAQLRAHGRAPERIVAIPDDALPDRAGLEGAGVGLLAIFSGDGTINSVLSRVHGWSGSVLVLPGGTQNLLAKALHGDLDVASIVALLGQGNLERKRRHTIRTSQGDAYCEVLAGPGAHWSDVREAMRAGDLGGVANSLGEAIGQSTSGALVHIAEPALGKAEGYPAVRVYPSGASLAVDGYAAETIADYARQGVALLRRDFREGPHDELGRHPGLVCRSSDPIELMIDGERSTGGCEERFEVAECPVEFLAASRQRASA
jgi:hypothetical protein